MSFLAPLFLLGVAALAGPILIHLVERESGQVIQFPSLMFLRKIPYKSMRRQRIRNWLLLLLRCAALLLLVLAFARPFFRIPALAAGASSGAREVVILVDQSYSMGYGDHWERARAAAREAVEGLGPDDRATLIFFSRGAQAGARSTTNRASLRASIDAAQVGSGVTRYDPALKLAQTILEESELARYEVNPDQRLPEDGLGRDARSAVPRRNRRDGRSHLRSGDAQRRRLLSLVPAGVFLWARARLRIGAACQYRGGSREGSRGGVGDRGSRSRVGTGEPRAQHLGHGHVCTVHTLRSLHGAGLCGLLPMACHRTTCSTSSFHRARQFRSSSLKAPMRPSTSAGPWRSARRPPFGRR